MLSTSRNGNLIDLMKMDVEIIISIEYIGFLEKMESLIDLTKMENHIDLTKMEFLLKS